MSLPGHSHCSWGRGGFGQRPPSGPTLLLHVHSLLNQRLQGQDSPDRHIPSLRCFHHVGHYRIKVKHIIKDQQPRGSNNILNNKKKCAFKKRSIPVCVSCSWGCLGTFAPSAAHLMVSLYLYSSGSNARGELRALEGHYVISKRSLFSGTTEIQVHR